MPNLTPRKPVVVVALDRPGGDAALRRVTAVGVPVAALVERGAEVADEVGDRVEVPTNHARIGPAVREAVDRETAWVAVPRSMGTADYLLSAGLRSVGKHLGETSPGIALLVCSAEVEPSTPYRRALAVVDLNGPGSSGMAALGAVELCVHSGAALDVLVLGLGEASHPSSRQEWRALLPVERRTELLRQAFVLSDSHGLEVTWVRGTSNDPLEAVAAAMRTSAYDVVIDSLGGHRLRRRIGKRHDIRRLIDDPAGGRVLHDLLQRSTCDVLVVLDAISLGMVPTRAVRAGAAAALALGVVGLGTPVAALTGARTVGDPAVVVQETSANQTLVEGGPNRPVAGTVEVKADEKEKKRTKTQVEKPGKPKDAKQSSASKEDATTSVTAAEFAEAERKAADARTEAKIAEQAAEQAEERARSAAAELSQARELLDAELERAEPASKDLVEARRALGEAKLAQAQAEDELASAQNRVNVVTELLTAGRVVAAVDDASTAAETAAEQSRQTQSAEAAAYEEYLKFAEDVDAAVERLVAAADDAERARATLDEITARAEAAAMKSTKLAQESKALAEALAEQGLHRPAMGGVTSSFGPRVHPVTGVYKQHTGTDFEGTDGNYYAAASGVVTYAGYDGAYGYMVKIDHGNIGGEHLSTWYAHQPGLSVGVGEHVERGQVIGRIGNTGYSTGPHAHVELHVNGTPVDLLHYLA